MVTCRKINSMYNCFGWFGGKGLPVEDDSYSNPDVCMVGEQKSSKSTDSSSLKFKDPSQTLRISN